MSLTRRRFMPGLRAAMSIADIAEIIEVTCANFQIIVDADAANTMAASALSTLPDSDDAVIAAIKLQLHYAGVFRRRK